MKWRDIIARRRDTHIAQSGARAKNHLAVCEGVGEAPDIAELPVKPDCSRLSFESLEPVDQEDFMVPPSDFFFFFVRLDSPPTDEVKNDEGCSAGKLRLCHSLPINLACNCLAALPFSAVGDPNPRRGAATRDSASACVRALRSNSRVDINQ